MQHVTVSGAQKLLTCYHHVLTVRFAQHKREKIQKKNKMFAVHYFWLLTYQVPLPALLVC